MNDEMLLEEVVFERGEHVWHAARDRVLARLSRNRVWLIAVGTALSMIASTGILVSRGKAARTRRAASTRVAATARRASTIPDPVVVRKAPFAGEGPLVVFAQPSSVGSRVLVIDLGAARSRISTLAELPGTLVSSGAQGQARGRAIPVVTMESAPDYLGVTRMWMLSRAQGFDRPIVATRELIDAFTTRPDGGAVTMTLVDPAAQLSPFMETATVDGIRTPMRSPHRFGSFNPQQEAAPVGSLATGEVLASPNCDLCPGGGYAVGTNGARFLRFLGGNQVLGADLTDDGRSAAFESATVHRCRQGLAFCETGPYRLMVADFETATVRRLAMSGAPVFESIAISSTGNVLAWCSRGGGIEWRALDSGRGGRYRVAGARPLAWLNDVTLLAAIHSRDAGGREMTHVIVLTRDSSSERIVAHVPLFSAADLTYLGWVR